MMKRFGDACPIVEIENSCVTGGRDDYWSGVEYR